MPKTKKKLKKKSKQRKQKCQEQGSEKALQIQFNVQIGDNNCMEMVAEEKINKEKCWEEKIKIGILLIKTILKSNCHRISVQDLQEQLNEVIEKGEASSVEILCGMSLTDFLLLNRDDFKVCKVWGTEYVSLEMKVTPGISKNEVGIVECATSRRQPSQEHQEKSSSDTDNMWTEVFKKKTLQKQQIECPLIPEKFNDNYIESLEVTRLKSLLELQEDRDLLFVPNHINYIDNNVQLLLDIVSMWNTPQRSKSYIVVGVEKQDILPHHLLGLPKDINDTLFDRELVFCKDYFTCKPLYNVIKVEYQCKLFLLIEIGISSGHGQPAIVKSAIQCGSVILKEQQMWYRKGASNVICPPTDPTTVSIYQWFSGSLSKTVIPELALDKEVKDTHMDLTSVSHSDKSHQQGQTMTEASNTFANLWQYVDQFRKGHFILMSGDVSNKLSNLEYLSLIKWIAVYDFDIFSCQDGLLNALQDAIEEKRQLIIRSWKDQAPLFSENSTYWCFIRGRKEISESRTDLPKEVIENTHSWFQCAKTGVIENCDQLERFSESYTVYTVFILWPKSEELVPFIRKFLDRLYETLSSHPKVVVCMHQKAVTQKGKTSFDSLQNDYAENIHICEMDFSKLCAGIENHILNVKHKSIRYELPRSNDCVTPNINEKDVMWLKEDLEVLYLEDPYNISMEGNHSNIENAINHFYKGGTLHWRAWYEKGEGSIEIDRDVLKDLEDKVKLHLEEEKSSVVTIFHAPGSGGSTLAQRILWKFHTKYPCIHTKLGASMRSKEFISKLSFIHGHTQLPILVLIDGEEETKIRYLCDRLKGTIFLYVKRYPSKMGLPKPCKDKVYLKGVVSPNEAEKLASIFGQNCDSTKRKRLEKLRKDVMEKKQHYLYEFGMTVYNHEFRGIVSYVGGYLQLNKNPSEELLPWQWCLGFLSLVYYYGQTSVPCQFFAAMFHKPVNYVMKLEEDFPHPTTEFIVYDTNDKKINTLRICHYEVAREILEQILTRRNMSEGKNRTAFLSTNACQNLGKFCKEFIKYCSQKKTKDNNMAINSRMILTKTFIYRDERATMGNEDQYRKKPKLSQLMQDIPSSKPLFTERLLILEQLSSSFPDDPNFLAHVGRFHAFCGSEDIDKAVDCFQKAIALCEAKTKGKHIENLDESTKSTLMHIYHMYGRVQLRRILKFISTTQDNAAVKGITPFLENLKDLVNMAEYACEYFRNCRDLTPDTYDVYTYAYTCEIQVRLHICDFVARYFRPMAGTADHVFKDFLESDSEEQSKSFVEDSITTVESLIHECYADVMLEFNDQSELRKLIKWYNTLFKKQVLPEQSLPADEGIRRKRLKIAQKKLQCGSDTSFSGIENIHDKDILAEIITLYEEIFNEIYRNGLSDDKITKKELEHDYSDWMCAIRLEYCERIYSIEEVIDHVYRWNQNVSSPLSLFYVFVLKSLLFFGTGSKPGKTDLDSNRLKTELAKKNSLIIRPKYPREWLGNNGKGIKVLQSGNRFIGAGPEGREIGMSRNMDLAVCKGTICPPNSAQFAGKIEMELRVGSVEVFFIPKVSHLCGQRYAGQRVEFNLAFTIEHGYEAYHVKLLTRHGCSKCNAKIEFTSVDSFLNCNSCESEVYKDEMNQINDSPCMENGMGSKADMENAEVN